MGLLNLIPLGLAKHLIMHIFSRAEEHVMDKLMKHLMSIYSGAQFVNFDKHLGSSQGKDFKEYVSALHLGQTVSVTTRETGFLC